MSDRGLSWPITIRFASVFGHWRRQLDCVTHSERFPVSRPGVGILSAPDDLIFISVSLAEDAESLAVQCLGGGPQVAVVIQYRVGVELAMRCPSLELG